MTTLIENGTVIGFDGEGHVILDGGVVAFEGNRIIHVGKRYSGIVDERVDARGKLVAPGFINAHCHSQTPVSPHHLTVDVGLDAYYQHDGVGMLTPLKGTTNRIQEINDWVEVARLSLVKRLTSGCTTFIEVGGGNKELVGLTAELGMRGYIAPGYRSASWVFDEKGRFGYEWDEEGGWRQFEDAVRFIEEHDGSHGGMIKGMLFPSQVDTCTSELFKATREKANEMGVGIQTHVGQRIQEFQEMIRRHLMTPVQFLNSVGLLGPDMIAGHCIFTTGHSRVSYPGDRDQGLLLKAGASIAYCPVVFSRCATAMESFGRNIRHGINMTLGTDNFPQDMVSEMRWASLLSKVVDFDRTSASSAEVFNAATLNGARALRRGDLGKLEPGAKADILVIDLQTTRVAPVYDPIKSLVNAATSENVEKVYCDGKLLVDGGRVIGVDEAALVSRVHEIALKEWGRISEWDYLGREAEKYAPLSFKRL